MKLINENNIKSNNDLNGGVLLEDQTKDKKAFNV